MRQQAARWCITLQSVLLLTKLSFHCSLAVVALGRMRNYLEYRRLPDWLVPAVIHELLGVLHIRWVGRQCCG